MGKRTKISFLLLSGLVGAALGLFLAWAQLSGLTIRWQNLGSPPERPVRIVAASSRAVWVETDSGKLYVAIQGDWSPSTGNLPSESAPQNAVSIRRQPGVFKDVVETRDSFDPLAGEYIFSRYALRADGSIYLWQDWPQQSDPGLMLLGIAVGAVLGCFLGLMVLFYQWLAKTSTLGEPTGPIREEILKFPRFGRW